MKQTKTLKKKFNKNINYKKITKKIIGGKKKKKPNPKKMDVSKQNQTPKNAEGNLLEIGDIVRLNNPSGHTGALQNIDDRGEYLGNTTNGRCKVINRSRKKTNNYTCTNLKLVSKGNNKIKIFGYKGYDSSKPETGYLSLAKEYPQVLFIFNDGLIGGGKGGNAEIREEPNAVGIPTGAYSNDWAESFVSPPKSIDEVNCNTKVNYISDNLPESKRKRNITFNNALEIAKENIKEKYQNGNYKAVVYTANDNGDIGCDLFLGKGTNNNLIKCITNTIKSISADEIIVYDFKKLNNELIKFLFLSLGEEFKKYQFIVRELGQYLNNINHISRELNAIKNSIIHSLPKAKIPVVKKQIISAIKKKFKDAIMGEYNFFYFEDEDKKRFRDILLSIVESDIKQKIENEFQNNEILFNNLKLIDTELEKPNSDFTKINTLIDEALTKIGDMKIIDLVYAIRKMSIKKNLLLKSISNIPKVGDDFNAVEIPIINRTKKADIFLKKYNNYKKYCDNLKRAYDHKHNKELKNIMKRLIYIMKNMPELPMNDKIILKIIEDLDNFESKKINIEESKKEQRLRLESAKKSISSLQNKLKALKQK